MNQDNTNADNQGTLSQNNINPDNVLPNSGLTSVPNYSSDETNAYATGVNTNQTAQNDIDSIGAEQRAVNNEATTHEAEAHHDGNRTNTLSGTLTNAENEVDRTNASLHNTTGRTTTGV